MGFQHVLSSRDCKVAGMFFFFYLYMCVYDDDNVRRLFFSSSKAPSHTGRYIYRFFTSPSLPINAEFINLEFPFIFFFFYIYLNFLYSLLINHYFFTNKNLFELIQIQLINWNWKIFIEELFRHKLRVIVIKTYIAQVFFSVLLQIKIVYKSGCGRMGIFIGHAGR